MKSHILHTPYQLGDLNLNNRIVMAPMTRSRADNPDQAPTMLAAQYYAQRASAGLIITEGTIVSPRASGYINVPGLYSEAQIEGWKLVTSAVHSKGGKIFAQLWHCGRISHPDFHGGELPLAPSAVNPHQRVYTQNGGTETVTPRAMTLVEIKQVIQDFRSAAENAIRAGFDGVEIHAANGYLFQQFFNGVSNHRSDDYGGTIENRARFLFEVLDSVREVIESSRIGVRLSPNLHGSFGITIDDMTIPTFDWIAQRLNNYELAYLHLIEFTPPDDVPYATPTVAQHFRPIYDGTLMMNGGLTDESASLLIENEGIDLVSFARSFLANPDLVRRFELGAPLNIPDTTTFYSGGAKGYTDYPELEEWGTPGDQEQ